jgi:predicted GIY-YIG superfamily endonuclease
MHYVHFLRSLAKPKKTCVGMTEDVPARLAVHNAGGCSATQRLRRAGREGIVQIQAALSALPACKCAAFHGQLHGESRGMPRLDRYWKVLS